MKEERIGSASARMVAVALLAAASFACRSEGDAATVSDEAAAAGTMEAAPTGSDSAASEPSSDPVSAIDALFASPEWAASTPDEKWRALARVRLGTPYALGCLGEEDENDADPVFRLDQADCTVLVLTNSALVRAASPADARARLIDIHYRGGVPTYASRIHFTADRITDSPWFADITARVAPESLLVPVSLTLNRKDDGDPLLPIDWERPLAISYLPSARYDSAVVAALPPVAGVAFVNEKNTRLGFLVSHEGIVFDGKTLHHASSLTNTVADTDLRAYLFEGREKPRFDGMLFYELK
ncbi:MAG: DUF1460 domain-containing protein [Gemmatimonadetes bacterium]|nr:DUF1460 domain-containing protein [Gemmatimonadota bacterium]